MSALTSNNQTSPAHSSLFGNAAERARPLLEFLDLVDKTRWNMRRVDWKPTEREVLDLLLLLTFHRAKQSHFCPDPQNQLALEAGIEDGNFFKAVKSLEKCRVIIRTKIAGDTNTAAGVEYFIDPDPAHWIAVPFKMDADEMLARRSRLLANLRQIDFPFEPETLSEVCARLGIENVMARSEGEFHPSAPQASPMGARAKGEFNPFEATGAAAGRPAEGLNSPSFKEEFKGRSSKLEALKSRVTGPERDFISACSNVLGEAMSHDGAKWRTRYREDPTKCERVLNDLIHEIKRADRGEREQIFEPAGFMEDSWKRFV